MGLMTSNTFEKINKPLMKKWVKALRGGKYKQVRNTLKTDDGYCCLGVLCEVSGLKFNKNVDGHYYVDNCVGTLPPTLKQKIGISSTQNTLILLNDTKRYSFRRIATFLEKKFLTGKKCKKPRS